LIDKILRPITQHSIGHFGDANLLGSRPREESIFWQVRGAGGRHSDWQVVWSDGAMMSCIVVASEARVTHLGKPDLSSRCAAAAAAIRQFTVG